MIKNLKNVTDEDLKWLIFYGHNKDKSIIIDDGRFQIDYALTQMFIMAKESLRFDVDGVERLLWKRVKAIYKLPINIEVEKTPIFDKEEKNYVRRKLYKILLSDCERKDAEITSLQLHIKEAAELLRISRSHLIELKFDKNSNSVLSIDNFLKTINSK